MGAARAREKGLCRAHADGSKAAMPIDPMPKLRRSALYRLGVDPGAYETAATFHPDVLVFEIEDSVPPGDKAAARARVVKVLQAGGFARQEKLVTVNPLATPWGRDDLAALAQAGADGLVLAKTESADMVRAA